MGKKNEINCQQCIFCVCQKAGLRYQLKMILPFLIFFLFIVIMDKDQSSLFIINNLASSPTPFHSDKIKSLVTTDINGFLPKSH